MKKCVCNLQLSRFDFKNPYMIFFSWCNLFDTIFELFYILIQNFFNKFNMGLLEKQPFHLLQQSAQPIYCIILLLVNITQVVDWFQNNYFFLDGLDQYIHVNLSIFFLVLLLLASLMILLKKQFLKENTRGLLNVVCVLVFFYLLFQK